MQPSTRMKNFSVLLALIVCAPLSAQISLGPGDFPDAGDTVRRSTAALIGFDGADTGPNHVWDFSALVPLTEVADTCVTVSGTPLLYQLYFNNPFDPDHDADLAVRGQGFVFGGTLTVSDVYDYFKKNSDGLRNVGFGANINGLPASIQRDPVDWIHHFPMNHGDEDSSYSYYELEVPGVLFFGQQQMRHNYVDGWGTLYLPTDTFDVLRVKSVLARVDTIHVTTPFPVGFTLPEPETVEYKWITTGMDGAVLQVTATAGVAATAEFHYSPDDISTGVAPLNASSINAYPNPATDIVYIRLPERSKGMLLVLDATGREAMRVTLSGASSIAEVNTAGLASGTYTLRMADSSWSGRLAIDRP